MKFLLWSLLHSPFSPLGLTYSPLNAFAALKILKSKPTGKIPLGRPRRRWESNIKVDLLRNGYHFEELG
jgi:hypothetical protein